MITERTLRKWRKDALRVKAELAKENGPIVNYNTINDYLEVTDRILRMTQELLDNHLVRKIRF